MRTDPLGMLDGLRAGRRVSLRLEVPEGPPGGIELCLGPRGGSTDRVGIVLGLDADELRLEDRSGSVHRIPRSSVRLAKLIPTVARGRSPRQAPAAMLVALAHDPALKVPGSTPAPCWIARLSDVVDHLDDAGVTVLAGRWDTSTVAARGDSRGLVNGEWAALRLVTAADLDPLAAWAARRNARNVVLTSPLSPDTLRTLRLMPLDERA